MKEYTNYIIKTLTVLDAFFEELDKLFKEMRTTGLQMRFNDAVENEIYYSFMKEKFEKRTAATILNWCLGKRKTVQCAQELKTHARTNRKKRQAVT